MTASTSEQLLSDAVRRIHVALDQHDLLYLLREDAPPALSTEQPLRITYRISGHYVTESAVNEALEEMRVALKSRFPLSTVELDSTRGTFEIALTASPTAATLPKEKADVVANMAVLLSEGLISVTELAIALREQNVEISTVGVNGGLHMLVTEIDPVNCTQGPLVRIDL